MRFNQVPIVQKKLCLTSAQEIGIRPGPLFGKLKQGQSVNFEGKTLKPEDFVGIYLEIYVKHK